MPQKPTEVSRAQLARLTGKTPQTVSQWIAEGMPAIKAGTRGQRVEIDLAEALPWLLDNRGAPPGSERERLAKEQADKFALDNATKRGELIRTEHLAHVLSEMIVSLRRNLEGVPARLAGQLAGSSKPAECRRLVLDEIRHAQAGFANDIAALSRPQ